MFAESKMDSFHLCKWITFGKHDCIKASLIDPIDSFIYEQTSIWLSHREIERDPNSLRSVYRKIYSTQYFPSMASAECFFDTVAFRFAAAQDNQYTW